MILRSDIAPHRQDDSRFRFPIDGPHFVSTRCSIRREYRYVRRVQRLGRFDARKYALGYLLCIVGVVERVA